MSCNLSNVVEFLKLKDCIKFFKKREIKEPSSCAHVLTKREIRQFHVVVSRGATVKNVQKRVMYVQSCCFGNLGQNCTDLPFVFTGPAESCKFFLSANSPRICDRVCMVRCKLFAQVKKFVRSKICPQPCKRRLNLLHF